MDFFWPARNPSNELKARLFRPRPASFYFPPGTAVNFGDVPRAAVVSKTVAGSSNNLG
jgi:hypothetical protein